MSWVISILANINCINFTGVYVWRSLLIRGYWCTDAVIHSCLKNKKSFFLLFCFFVSRLQCKKYRVSHGKTSFFKPVNNKYYHCLLRMIFSISNSYLHNFFCHKKIVCITYFAIRHPAHSVSQRYSKKAIRIIEHKTW